jgi:hypothetical protein
MNFLKNYYIPKWKNGGHIIGMLEVGHLSFIYVNENGKLIFNALKMMHYMSQAWKKLNNKIFKEHEQKEA